MFKRWIIVSFSILLLYTSTCLFSIDGKTLVSMNKKAVAAGHVKFSDLSNFSLIGKVEQYGLMGGVGVYSSGRDSFSIEKEFNTFSIKMYIRGSLGGIKDLTGWTRELNNGEFSDFEVLHYMLSYGYLKKSISEPMVQREDDTNVYATLYAPQNIKIDAVFDKNSNLLKSFKFVNSLLENVNVSINEYRFVGGYRLPSKITVDGINSAKYSFTRIEVNQGVSSNRFAITPESISYSLPETGIVQLPVDVYFGLPFVKVWIGNSPALTFLLDTDLPFSVIDSSIVTQLGFKPVGKIKQYTRYLPNDFSVVSLPSVLIRDIQYKNQIFLTTNMLSPSINIQMPIHGILGANFFHQNILGLDLNNNNIWIYSPKHFKPKKNWTKVPLSVHRGVYSLQTNLGQNSIDLELCTSLGDSIQIPEKAVVVKTLLQDRIPLAKGYSTGVLSGLDEKVFKLNSISLDNLKIKYPFLHAVSFPDNNPMSRYNGGWVGCGILKRFVAYFDFPQKILYLEPNNLLNSPDLFNSVGIYVIKSNDNNIVIQKVAKGSAAEKAGIKPGDIILKIKQYNANQIVFDRIYYNFSVESGYLIPLVLQRDGKTINVTIKTETPF